MKSINRLLILMAIVLLSMNYDAIGQEGQTHIVTLYVNTADFDPSNPAASCYLIALSPGEDPKKSGTGAKSIEDFTIHVNPGDYIFWNGLSSSSPGTDDICIKMIKYKRGPRIWIFSKDELKGRKEVRGRVKSDAIKTEKDKEFEYKIKVKVPKKSTFWIDPKIQIN